MKSQLPFAVAFVLLVCSQSLGMVRADLDVPDLVDVTCSKTYSPVFNLHIDIKGGPRQRRRLLEGPCPHTFACCAEQDQWNFWACGVFDRADKWPNYQGDAQWLSCRVWGQCFGRMSGCNQTVWFWPFPLFSEWYGGSFLKCRALWRVFQLCEEVVTDGTFGHCVPKPSLLTDQNTLVYTIAADIISTIK